MAQTAKAVLFSDAGGCVTEEVLIPAAGEHGDVIQTADGRAGVILGADQAASTITSGSSVTVAKTGQFKFLKTASINLLAGGKVYWDRSAETATFEPASGDFFLGRVVDDALAAAATVTVDLNVEPRYAIELGKGRWLNVETNGLGVTPTSLASGGTPGDLTLAFDAQAEAATAALYSVDTIPVADGPIFEAKVAIFGIGDDAALDINIGIANATHATDFDSVTEACVFHWDGTALSILAESDDGTTEVAATDTTVDAVDDTYLELWIDTRDIDDIQLYIDGVNVLPATEFKLDAATGPMLPIIHVEKTSNDTVADVRVEWMRVRSTDLTS